MKFLNDRFRWLRRIQIFLELLAQPILPVITFLILYQICFTIHGFRKRISWVIRDKKTSFKVVNFNLTIFMMFPLFKVIISIDYTSTNPMTYALTELLRGQLELTENFLNSQKHLYSTFVNSLNSAAVQQQLLEDKLNKKLEKLKLESKDQIPSNKKAS